MELWLTVNGKRAPALKRTAGYPGDPRRGDFLFTAAAEPDDTPTSRWDGGGIRLRYRMHLRYGSRLWLLQRSKLTNQLVQTVSKYPRMPAMDD